MNHPLGSPMPEGAGARLDTARATLAALEHEQRRLERLGFELPLARCHGQIRFWRFASAVLSLDAGSPGATQGGSRWPDASR